MPEFKVELVSISELKAWELNPRERDLERLEWIKLSIQKFGFVSPVYADAESKIIYSGHQRTTSAMMLGMQKVPVMWIPPIETLEDKDITVALNVVFNLCTNDHDTKADFGQKAKRDIKHLVEQIKMLPDTRNLYPVMNFFNISPLDYSSQCTIATVNNTTKKMADFLSFYAIDIPVLLSKKGKILNGVNRLSSALTSGRVSYPAVVIDRYPDQLKEFMNKITMSFDLQKVFGEKLRYNSFFFRLNQACQRDILGVGFYHWVFKKDALKGKKAWLMQNMTKLEGENRARWIAEHGTTVIDFGAGRLDNTEKLKASGIDCIPFEPYIMKPKTDMICVKTARVLAKRFLSWVKQKKRLDSVFCSSVFNSVPFAQDREYLMRIFQALCLHGAKLYLTTLAESGIINRLFKKGDNKTQRLDVAYLLDTEPGLMVGNLLDRPKVQKYHSTEELIAQGKRYFFKVDYVKANSASHGIKCEGSRQIDWLDLIKALEFEFDLPYPNDERMGLQNEALEAFSIYCEQDLFRIKQENSLLE